MSDKPVLRRHQAWLPSATWDPLSRDLHVTADHLDRRVVRGDERAVVQSTWLETPLVGGWMSAARLVVQGGLLVVAELRIFPLEPALASRPAGMWSAELLGDAAPAPSGGLSVKTVRRVRLGDYRRYTTRILGQLQDKYRSAPAREALGRAFGPVMTTQPLARPRRERPGARPDTFYAGLARQYERATARGSRQPVVDLAKRHGVKPSQMRDMIREARERGLLSFFAHGRPGGVVTDRGREVLKQPMRRTRR